MRIEADVAFWYGEVLPPKEQNLADEVLRRVDAVTVMSYRDTATGPNSVTAVGADFLRRGAALGRPVRLGVETQPLAECAYWTFAEEGTAALDGAFVEIAAAGSAYATYAASRCTTTTRGTACPPRDLGVPWQPWLPRDSKIGRARGGTKV